MRFKARLNKFWRKWEATWQMQGSVSRPEVCSESGGVCKQGADVRFPGVTKAASGGSSHKPGERGPWEQQGDSKGRREGTPVSQTAALQLCLFEQGVRGTSRFSFFSRHRDRCSVIQPPLAAARLVKQFSALPGEAWGGLSLVASSSRVLLHVVTSGSHGSVSGRRGVHLCIFTSSAASVP